MHRICTTKSEAEEAHITRRLSWCKSSSGVSKSRLLDDESESDHSATPLLICLTIVEVTNDALR